MRNRKWKARKGKNIKKITGTKKCGCPFLLRATQISIDGHWSLEVVCGVHNHPCAQYLEGHSFVGRLTKEEHDFVEDLTKSNSRPRDILDVLKERFPDNKSSMITIYNARQKNRLIDHAGRSQMQYLMGKLREHSYFYHH